MPLKIRMPVVLEFTLSDSEISDLAERIREDRGGESTRLAVTDQEIISRLCEDANDDLATLISDLGPAAHIDEDATKVAE